MARKQTLYISSTFEDLKAHRAELKTSLERAGYDVESMERYAAFSEPPLEKCTADVAACDGYVLLLAYRYGYQPAIDGQRTKSITELEYEEARRNDKPVFVFCLDDDHPWARRFMDEGETAQHLARFRQRVQESHGRALFTDPDNLAKQVLEAVSSHRWAGTEASAPKASPYLWPVAWDFSALIVQKREHFEGRDWLFEEIAAWAAAPQPRALLMRADFGVGKSAVMAELVARNPGGSMAAWYFCQHDTQETLRPATFVRHLAAQLAIALPDYRQRVEQNSALQDLLDRAPQDPGTALEAAILAPLAGLSVPPSVKVVLIDALDEALELQADGSGATTIISLLAAKASRFPAWLRILASSRPNPAVTGRLQAAFGTRELDAEGAGNIEDLRRYVRRRCAHDPLAAVLGQTGMSAHDIEDLLVQRSGGKFLYAVRALRDVETGVIGFDALRALPPGMDSFYFESFERRFARAGVDYARTRAMLGILATAHEPVSPSMLASVLETDEAEVRAVHRSLPDFLRQRGNKLAFDHFSMAEWLTQSGDDGFARAGEYAVDPDAARRRWRAWALQVCEERSAHRHEYLARHLVDHLQDAAERRRVFGVLMLQDVDWLQARIAQVGIDGLIVDARMLLGLLEQPLLLALLRSSAHVLRRAPEHLAGQVIGRTGALPGCSDDVVLPALAESAVRFAADPDNADLLSRVLLPTPRSLQMRLGLTFNAADDVDRLFTLRDSRIVAANEYGDSLRIWDTDVPDRPPVTLAGAAGVTSLLELSDGRLAVTGLDDQIRIWDLASPESPIKLSGHRPRGPMVELPDGRLASVGQGGALRVWSLTVPPQSLVLDGEHGALALLNDGRLAAAAADGATLRIFDSSSLDLLLQCHTASTGLLNMMPLADGRVLMLYDAEACVVDPAVPGEHGHRASIPSFWPTKIVTLNDGRLIACERAEEPSLLVIDPDNLDRAYRLQAHGDGVTDVATLPDGRLASVGFDRMLRLWNAQTLAVELALEVHAKGVFAVAALGDGRLVSGALDGSLRVWNPDLQSQDVEQDAARGLRALAGLPDGRLAALGDLPGGGVRIWSPSRQAGPLSLVCTDCDPGGWRELFWSSDGMIAILTVGETARYLVWKLSHPEELPLEVDTLPVGFAKMPWVEQQTVQPRLGVTGKVDGTIIELTMGGRSNGTRRFIADADIRMTYVMSTRLVAVWCQDGTLLFLRPPEPLA